MRLTHIKSAKLNAPTVESEWHEYFADFHPPKTTFTHVRVVFEVLPGPAVFESTVHILVLLSTFF
jgi:hypothetical protein